MPNGTEISWDIPYRDAKGFFPPIVGVLRNFFRHLNANFCVFLFQFSPGIEYACANPYAFCMSDFVYGFLFICFIAKIAEFVEIEIEFEGADIF